MYRIGQEELEAVKRVFESRYLFRIDAPFKEAEQFEKEWAYTIGTKYCLALSGGTNALISALVGMEVGPGDEVIIPSYTFIATGIAVLAVGAIPVVAEIDESLTIDTESIREKISQYTKAIIPVHINGFPCNMDEIIHIAKEHNLMVLEDACQADGGGYNGKRLGSIGDAGTFSFNHFKILSAGEGGALVTDNRNIYERALIYHDGGTAFRPYASELSVPVFTGNQHRISEITGAILRVQHSRLETILYDLRAKKKAIQDSVPLETIPSYDIEGDCGSTICFLFNNESQARVFSEKIGPFGWLPIDSDKHVYKNWTPILNKRGGPSDYFNPYLMKENRGRQMELKSDSCPKSLNLLSRTVCISVKPDWSEQELANISSICIKSAGELS